MSLVEELTEEKLKERLAKWRREVEEFNAWRHQFPHPLQKTFWLEEVHEAYWRARNNGATADDLLAGAARYAAECHGKDDRFVKPADDNPTDAGQRAEVGREPNPGRDIHNKGDHGV